MSAPLFIFALALVVRGLYLAELSGSPLLEALAGDALLFDEWARRIAGGDWRGEEVFFQAPLYPYFMAAVYQLTGADPFHVRVVQGALGSLGCALLAMAGRQLLSPSAGLAAGAILALYPPAVFFDGLVQKASIALFLTCTLLALVGGHRAAAARAAGPGRRAATGALLLGIVLGLLGLTRENALVLVPVLGAWLLLGLPSHPWRTRSAWLAAFGAGVALILVPVGLRNLAVGGEFLITTSNFGSNFYIGNNPEADGHYRPLRRWRGSFKYERADALELAREASNRELGPGEASRYWLERGLDFARSQPFDWLALMGRKLAMVLNAREYVDSESMEAYEDESWMLAAADPWLHFGVLFPVAVLGAVLGAGRWRELWVLPLAFLVMALGIAVFFVLARFRLPLVPMLALFAAGLTALPRVLAARAHGRLLGAGALAAAAALLSGWPIPGDADPRLTTYRNMAASLIAEGRHAKALELLERAAARGGEPPALRAQRARVLARVGRRKEAVALYRDVLRERPGDWGTRAELAGTLADRGQVEEALEASRPFLHAGRERLRAFAEGSPEFFRQVVDAERSAAEALRRQPEDPGARLNHAVWLALRDRHESALRECRRALEAAPDHPVGRWLLLDLQWWIQGTDASAGVPLE